MREEKTLNDEIDDVVKAQQEAAEQVEETPSDTRKSAGRPRRSSRNSGTFRKWCRSQLPGRTYPV
jgi:hypothetical protein